MRLIDADELIRMYFDDEDGNKTFEFIPVEFVDEAPTIEAEPIVRCEDCKYWVCIEHEGMQHTACKLSENPRVPEYLYHPSAKDFCSRGERSTDDSD